MNWLLLTGGRLRKRSCGRRRNTMAMKIGMRWVFQQITHHGVAMEAGQKPCLCFKGRKHMLAIAIGHPVRVIKRVAADFDKLRVVQQNGVEYTLPRAIEQYTSIISRNGATMGAQRLLQMARDRAAGTEVADMADEDEFTNEEDLTMAKPENPNPVPEGTEGESATTTEPTTTKEKEVTKAKKKAAAKPAPKAKAAKAKTKPTAAKAKPAGKPMKSVEVRKGAPRLREGSTVAKAYDWWKEQLLKHDDPKSLDRGVRKDICERMNAKFGIKSGAGYYQYFTKHFGLPK